MQREYPHAPFRPLGKGGDIDILIAGCGTGRHSIGVAQQFERSKVLAIDLSAASLGYAKARTGALGVTNIDYAQADILQLGATGRTFDMIQSAGVLHHLADPWAGMARAAVAAAPRRRDVRRALQRDRAARRRGGARVHRGTRLRIAASRISAPRAPR